MEKVLNRPFSPLRPSNEKRAVTKANQSDPYLHPPLSPFFFLSPFSYSSKEPL